MINEPVMSSRNDAKVWEKMMTKLIGAQPVYSLMLSIAYCMLIGLCLLEFRENAWATSNINLYVNAAAIAGGDGTQQAPFRRITDAVTRARSIWLSDNNTGIEIQIAPGTYVGS